MNSTKSSLPFELDLDRNCIIYSDNKGRQQRQSVEPRVMSLLQFFCKHPNQLITREQLVEHVWQGQVVGDNAINRAVSQLRKSLESMVASAATIETIPRKGYQFNIHTPSKNDHSKSIQKSRKRYWIWPLIMLPLTLIALEAYIFWSGQSLRQQLEQVTPIVETAMPGVEYAPAPSPDGRWLVYVHYDAAAGGRKLYLKIVGQDKNWVLTDDEFFNLNPVWSHDGTKLAFARWNDQHQRVCSLWYIDLSGVLESDLLLHTPPPAQSLGSCGQRARPVIAWNSDSSGIYYTDRQSIDEPYQVFYRSVATSNRDQISLPPQDGNLTGDFFIASQATHQRLAIVRYQASGQSKILIFDMADNEVQHSFEIDFEVKQVEWLSDSDRLVVTRQGDWWLYDIKNGSGQWVFRAGENSYAPTFSADGRRVFYSYGASSTDLEMYQTNNNQAVELAVNSSEREFSPQYVADNRFYFISSRSGKAEFWRYDSELGLMKVSKLPVNLVLTTFAVTPDERFIFYQYKDEIYRWQVDGQKNEKVLDRQHHAYVVSWTDNERLIYSSDKSGEWQLWMYNHVTEKHQQLTQSGGYSGKLDANDNLYYSKLHKDGLWRKSLIDGDDALVIKEFPRVNWLNWRLTNTSIYYHAASPSGTGIYQYSLPDQSNRLLMPLSAEHLNQFDVAHDGQSLIVVKQNLGEYKIMRIDIE